MPTTRRRRVTASILAVPVTALMACLAAPVAARAEAPATAPAMPPLVSTGVPTVTTTTTKIALPTRDGTLAATINAPTTPAPTDSGRWPLIVIPGTYASDSASVDPNALILAQRGYVTVTYLERGFGASTGELDAGGPQDVGDVQDAITWSLAHLQTDPARVGVFGLSYGGGIALEAAAADSRVKAVAEIAGWADLGRALYPYKTPATVTRQSLYALAVTGARPSPEVRTNFENAVNNVKTRQALAFVAQRSVATVRAQLEARHTALFMAHEMNETVFPIDQAVDFFNAYSGGPKHLDLRPGDHGGQEAGYIVGQNGPSWKEVYRWFDAYVAGYDRSIASEPAVRVQPRSPNGPHALESSASTQGSQTQRLYLSTQSQWFGTTRSLTTSPGTGTGTLREGTNWLVHVSLPIYPYLLEVVTGAPPTVPLGLVDQSVSGIWQTAQLPVTTSLRGAVSVHLSVTPSASTATLVLHVVDVDALGVTGYLVAHQPVTFSGTPGASRTLDVTLPNNAYDVPPGHRLAVVVSTSDPSYTSANRPGSSIEIGPSSWVDVPLR